MDGGFDMNILRRSAAAWIGIGLSLGMAACGGSNSVPPPSPTVCVLTVDSATPASGVAVTVSPADNSGAANGTTSFTRSYNSGSSVTLTAPATSGGNNFSSWTGCTTASAVTCSVTMNADTTVTANYSVPPPTVYVLTVDSTTPASGVAVTVSPADNNGAANGTTSFTRSYNSGSTVTLTAPATAGGNTFASWSGCTTASTVTCTVTMNAGMTVTANYASAPITPTVTVTPSATVIASTQAWTVAVAVSGGSGAATPTGSVTLTTGSFTSTAATLSGGSATINIPAGAVVSGNNTLTVTYAPDAASSSIYSSASGMASVIVPAGTSYVVTVNSINPSSGVLISQVCIANVCPLVVAPPIPTPFTFVAGAGASIGLMAPATAGGNTFAGWAGCAFPANGEECILTVTGNMTVTAFYVTPATITPTVTVTPSASSITTAQTLLVAVSVSGGSGNPTPTGTVTLSAGGTYSSAPATLSNGSVSINVPAGSIALPTGTFGANFILTVAYTPDTASSSIYSSAQGTSPLTEISGATNVLTVNSTGPSGGVSISVSPADNNGASSGTTNFALTYYAGTPVTLTAPATSGNYTFVSWTGCFSHPSANACGVNLDANTTVTANYSLPAVTSITVLPNTATIGMQQQFTATVAGIGSFSSGVTWSLTCPSCGSLSPGTLSSTGLYTTPYPAPATVTVTATSTMAGFTNVSGSVTVTLSPPATAAGPALTVNVGAPGNPISPLIYGMDTYLLHATAADASAVAPTNITVDRWGGDSTERYNYQLDVTSSIADWYFENSTGNGGDGWPAVSGVKAFDALVESNNTNGIKTLGTVPVLGWVAKDSTSCSFPASTYPSQYAFDPYNSKCGDGETTSQTDITGNSPTLTSIAEPPPTPPAASAVTAAWADATWTGGWVNYLVNKFGSASGSTGVAIYDLDNEPSWWDAEDRDVHPLPFTYDEVTLGGIGTALAIKTVDPTAQVSGPVMDYWWDYFYSKQDVESGWHTGGPCYEPWSNPVDRKAHGGVPFIEYYLQQFAAAQSIYNVRLLDYVDLHTYFAADYPTGSGNSVAFATAGDTGAQQARLNSTRVFWDPTYKDASNQFPQPNYITDSNYTASCSPPQQAPQLIPMMKNWVAADYPGTKLAIDEYNWGGMESINGALAQADILGIFGREGLDLGTMWPTTDPSAQNPGMMAFQIYRNYDGANSTFGDTVLPSTSANQGQLSVYGAIHTTGAATGTATVMVINKTYGSLTSTVSLTGLSSTVTTAQAYLYSNANLAAIVAQPAVTVTPGTGGTASTIANYSFPAQSITLFVVP